MCSTQPEQHLQVPHQLFNGSRRLRSHPLGGCGMPHMLYYTQISNNFKYYNAIRRKRPRL